MRSNVLCAQSHNNVSYWSDFGEPDYLITVCNIHLQYAKPYSFLEFEAIALVPFEKKLVKVDMLDNDEVGDTILYSIKYLVGKISEQTAYILLGYTK